MDPVGLRLQTLDARDQVLALGRLAETRDPQGLFSVSDIDELFDHIGLPPPSRTRDTISGLVDSKLVMRDRSASKPRTNKLTPKGRSRAQDLASDMDLRAVLLETGQVVGALAHTPHPGDPAQPGAAGPDPAPAQLLRRVPLRVERLRHDPLPWQRRQEQAGPDRPGHRSCAGRLF